MRALPRAQPQPTQPRRDDKHKIMPGPPLRRTPRTAKRPAPPRRDNASRHPPWQRPSLPTPDFAQRRCGMPTRRPCDLFAYVHHCS